MNKCAFGSGAQLGVTAYHHSPAFSAPAGMEKSPESLFKCITCFHYPEGSVEIALRGRDRNVTHTWMVWDDGPIICRMRSKQDRTMQKANQAGSLCELVPPAPR